MLPSHHRSLLWIDSLIYNYKIQICIPGAYIQTSTIVEPHARTAITADNWTLLFAQLTDSQGQVNLGNVETSLSTVCAIICLSLQMVNNLSWRHVNVFRATPDRMICKCQLQTILASYELPGNVMTALWRLEMFNLTILMSSFISSVNFQIKLVFLTLITWPT